MKSKSPLYYWDASLFIDLVQKVPEHYEVLNHIIGQAKTKEVRIVTSHITLTEVYKPHSEFEQLLDAHEALLTDLFENDYIILRTADRNVCTKAREIRRYHHLPTADALHVATALL
jgi:predicted nucleic acid-binding protein